MFERFRLPILARMSLAITLSCLGSTRAHAGLTITPTFDASITGDANAAAIEATINQATQVYRNLFSDPITFREMTTGLGQSNFFF